MDLIFQLDKGAYKPLKAHQNDAGFDLFTPQDFVLKENSTKIIDTGVHVAIPQGFVGLVLGRSSMSQKGVLTHIGVIDADYLGAIKIMLSSENEAVLYQGNKIAQLVILPLPQFNLIEGDVTKLKTERGCNGFGSSGGLTMNKSKYIKALEKIEGDPHIVINVLCTDGSSEAWGIDDHSFKLVDNGTNLALFQVRTKEPINKRLARKVQAIGVKSVNCDLKSCLEKWREKFDLPQDCDIKNYDVQDLILFSIRKEIAELVTLNDDFIRLFGNKAEHLKYKLEE